MRKSETTYQETIQHDGALGLEEAEETKHAKVVGTRSKDIRIQLTTLIEQRSINEVERFSAYPWSTSLVLREFQRVDTHSKRDQFEDKDKIRSIFAREIEQLKIDEVSKIYFIHPKVDEPIKNVQARK